MKIAVTGATGFVGSHLVPYLAAAGHEVRALVRPGSRTSWAGNAAVFPVDYEVPEALVQAFRGCGLVIHLLGIINGSEAALENTNVEITRRVLEACRQAAVPRLIHMSSVAAVMGHGPYGRSKARGEALVRKSGIPCVILQPAYIYGPGDRHLTRRMSLVLRYSPVVPVLGGGDFKIQPVYVGDVCQAVLAAVNRDFSGDINTFILAGPEQVALKEMLRLMAQAMGVRRLFLPVPLRPVQALCRVLLGIFPETRFPLKQVLELDKHQAFKIDAAQTELAFRPIPFREGVFKLYEADRCAA